jgi:hypothetical protein
MAHDEAHNRLKRTIKKPTNQNERCFSVDGSDNVQAELSLILADPIRDGYVRFASGEVPSIPCMGPKWNAGLSLNPKPKTIVIN